MKPLYKKLKAVAFGHYGETLSRQILRLKGYKIIDQNVRTPLGEIDIIALRGKTLCFIEVKSRSTMNDALFALTIHQRKRIIRAAYTFLSYNPCYVDFDKRFDLIAISPMRYPVHIKNAWDEE